MKGSDIMHKRLLKLISLALAFFIAITVTVPGSVNAENGSEQQIKQQIKRTYSKALAMFKRSSFDGYCGTLTGYQLYILGITAQPDLRNGKDGFDTYCNQKVSSGGYGIRAYGARSWTLREALDDITDYGICDAYNILVGFQATPSARGGRYGHSCVIHAIIDGQVYFMESYDVKLNGAYYPEGSPISCSIEDFCTYYNKTTTKFDGVIHFGAKEYVDLCHSYPSNFYGAALESAELRTQPCTDESDSSSELIERLAPGQQLHVTGTVENTQGEFWYQLEGELSGYVRAEQVQVRQFLFDDVTAEKIKSPTVLTQGENFQVEGEIISGQNMLHTVRLQIYRMDGGIMEQVCAAYDIVDGKRYNLKGSLLSEKLELNNLGIGSYRFELATVIGNYYYDASRVSAKWETVSLWNSDFQISPTKQEARVLTFDASGGKTNVNSKAFVPGTPVKLLPKAHRGNDIFLGWFTRPEGGEPITENTIPEENMIVYAQWSNPKLLTNAFSNAGRCWYFYSDGISSMGCVELDGMIYYFANPDAAGSSGLVWSTVG